MESVNGAAALLRRTIQDVAVRLGGSLWAKRCAVAYANQHLRDIYQRRVPYTSGCELSEHWAFALDSEVEAAAKGVWDFFCHRPILPAKDAMTGLCDTTGAGTIAFLNPDSSAVYLGTTYAAVPVVMAGSDGVYLTTWGDALRHAAKDYRHGPSRIKISFDTPPAKALQGMAKRLLGIELKGGSNG